MRVSEKSGAFFFTMEGIILNNFGAVIREKPNRLSKPIGKLEMFQTVDIEGEMDDWVLVDSGLGHKGYVKKNYISYTGR